MDFWALGTGVAGFFSEGIAAMLALREVHGHTDSIKAEVDKHDSLLQTLLLKLAGLGEPDEGSN